jgi:heme-degrading monooxygenase HmoA
MRTTEDRHLCPMIQWLTGITPAPPYFAAIFSSLKRMPRDGYPEMDAATIKAVESVPGYLGHQTVSNGDRNIFISYWKDEAAIAIWRDDRLHRAAKDAGRASWYEAYDIQICEVRSADTHRRPA